MKDPLTQNNKMYDLINISYQASKQIPNLMAHLTLGFLPEQELLEKKISWYDSKIGVELSGMTEVAATLFISTIDSNLTQLACYSNALSSIMTRYSTLSEDKIGNRNTNIFGTQEHLGNIYLEMAYRPIKKIVKNLTGLL
ncbi:MAG: hypothetical protein ABIF18_00840 [archaeon]